MFAIKVSVDSHAFEAELGRFRRDQIPFASAVALTRTAKVAQDAVRDELPRHLTLRNAWSQKGIRSTSASKRDWPDQSALVGSIDERMVETEGGGTRMRPIRGRSFVYASKAIQPDRQKLIPRGKLPKSLLKGIETGLPYRNKRGPIGTKKKPLPFIAVTKRGDTGIFIRTDQRNAVGKGSGSRRPVGRQKIKLLYRFDHKPVHIGNRAWLVSVVQRVAEKEYPTQFERELLKALGNAR